MRLSLDKLGTIGLFFAALASPCCFPILGLALSAYGVGTFELFGEWTMWVLQGLVLISLIGLFFSYRSHKNIFPVSIAIISTLLIIYSSNIDYTEMFMYSGMFGMLASTGINFYIGEKNKNCSMKEIKLELKSIITCPSCGVKKEEIMPTGSCQWFYECESCKRILKPKHGDCCVYCSYGTVKCPPIQNGNSCC